MARDHTKLQVFHRAHRLALDVYKLTTVLPTSERYGLAAQLRRAAVSVPTNIVEGCARESAREYGRFVEVSVGSAVEVRYLLDLAGDLGLFPEDELNHCKVCSEHVVRALKKLHSAINQLAQ